MRLNHEKTDGFKANINVVFTDSNEVWALEAVEFGAEQHQGPRAEEPGPDGDLEPARFLAMVVQGKKLPELVQAGLAKVEGDPTGVIVNNVMNFEPVFAIVTP